MGGLKAFNSLRFKRTSVVDTTNKKQSVISMDPCPDVIIETPSVPSGSESDSDVSQIGFDMQRL